MLSKRDTSSMNAFNLHPADPITVSSDTTAVEDVQRLASRIKRDGNFLLGALNVVQHVEATQGLNVGQRTRLQPIIWEAEHFHETQLANVRAFREAMFPTQDKITSDSDEVEPTNFSRLLGSMLTRGTAPPEQDSTLAYWRSVRDDLMKWFVLSLEPLSDVLGIAYATFANLGKHRPQGRTIRPVLTLHGLAKAYIDARGEAAYSWLATEGCRILAEGGITPFEAAVNKRIFVTPPAPEQGITVSDQDDDDLSYWRSAEVPRANSERF